MKIITVYLKHTTALHFIRHFITKQIVYARKSTANYGVAAGWRWQLGFVN